MKSEQDSIVRFILPDFKPEIILTHGYNVTSNSPVHFHKTFNVGVVEKGERVIEIRGNKHLIQTSDIFVIPPFEPHRIYSEKESNHSYKIISFTFHELAGFFFPELIIKNRTLFCLIENFHNQAEYDYSVENCTRQLVTIKESFSKYALQDDNDWTEWKEPIRKACDFIELHCSDHISLKDIAESAFLSQFHFNRLFHKYTGMSPYAYLVHCRIKLSQRQIDGESLLTDVAYDNGFYDQSHFVKTFKRHTGVSPKKYRNRIRDSRQDNYK